MASNNIARLGVVLGLDTAEFTAAIDKVMSENRKLGMQLKRDMNAAAAEVSALKFATEDYGKTLTKVQLIEREIQTGRYQNVTQQMKQTLLQQAAAYDAVASSAGKAQTGIAGLNAQQKMNLTYQTTDFFTQLASGQNMMVAAIQQGGQLKDSLGGLGAMFRVLGGMIFSFTGALVALASGLGGIAYGAYKGREEFDKLRDSLTLTGNYAGVTQSSFSILASTLSTKLNVGVGDARTVLNSLVATGDHASNSFNIFGETILRFARLSGINAKEAADKLIPSLDGTAASAYKLNQQYNFLTLAQYKHIESLADHNKKQEAAIETATLLNKSLKSTEAQLGSLDKIVLESTKIWQNFWAGVYNLGKPDSPDVAIVALSAAIAKLKKEQSEMSPGHPLYGMKGLEIKKFQDEQNRLIEAERIKADAYSKSQEEKQKLEAYKNSGGISAARTHAASVAKAELEARYTVLSYGADEFTKIELEYQKQRETILLEETTKNAEQNNYFAVQNAKERYAKLNVAAAAFLDKMNEFEDKRYKFAEQKHEADQERIKRERGELDVSLEKTRLLTKATKEKTDSEMISLNRQQEVFMLDTKGMVMKAEDLKLAKELAAIEYTRFDNRRKLSLTEGLADSDRQIAMEAENTLATEAIRLARERYSITKGIQEGGAEQGLRVAMAKFANGLPTDFQLAQTAFESVMGNMSQALDNFVKTGKLNFKDFARSIIQDLIAIQLKAQANRLLSGLFSALSFSSSAMPGEGLAAGYAKADGGPVSGNNAYLVGERGPEIFMPPGSGTIIPNHALSMGGGTTNVTNNYINAIDAKSFEDRLLGSSNTIWAANAYANKSLAVSRGRT